ncbi:MULTISPECIES: methyl-accepting chemotaxis protein [unclassified Paenibacillus]|uniref:methyl-accepting chemotaxis protein n=1 Tax=unclassified Paenibacillus TaxID=185978 RepID=UPI001AE9BB0E|nr:MULTISPECIES: methyl-accepting chemotaxis protein [unclassified Paenibacillus]MBP1157011.1 methyl-accepting chemotaxis protein [Paenibacillus sp. PvP091]MBP1172250.1 methyl-accepting chemotaxis protein [Paenibacillus sp. PvR098]MBP2438631.1 methyl-accepting chemotaxis protein [Paenibacillus sp. PvP052]
MNWFKNLFNWFHNLKISLKFILSFSVVLLILVAIGVFGITNASKINSNLEDIYKNRLVAITELGTVATNLHRINSSIGSYLLSKDVESRNVEKSKIDESAKMIEEALQGLSVVQLYEAEKKELELFLSLWEQYLPEVQKVYGYVDNNQMDFAITHYQRHVLIRMNGVDRSFQNFIGMNEENAHTAYTESNKVFQGVLQFSTIFIVVSFIVSALLGYLMTSSIRKPLNQLLGLSERIGRGDLSQKIDIKRKDEFGDLAGSFEKMRVNLIEIVENVKHSSAILSGLFNEIRDHADNTGKASNMFYEGLQESAEKSRVQSEQVTNDAIIIKEMAHGLQQVAGSIDQIGIHSIEMEQSSTSGVTVVQKAVEKISHVQKEVHHSFETMNHLVELSREIEQVMHTIRSIAEETNLLSLNASIEAARAGDAGRGFAVVAHEVRKLADNSSQAANHVQTMISKIQEGSKNAMRSIELSLREIDDGQARVGEAGSAFSEIQSWILNINNNIQDVSASVEELAAGSQQINVSIQGIEQFSSQTAQSSQEFAAISAEQIHSMDQVIGSIRQLYETTQEMNTAINRFVLK